MLDVVNFIYDQVALAQPASVRSSHDGDGAHVAVSQDGRWRR
jgi:uncharacterized metal-binding protein YceD (DUF177 family)